VGGVYNTAVAEEENCIMIQRQGIEILLEQLANGSASDPDAQWKAAIALGEVQSAGEKQRAVPALIESLTSGRAHALIRAHAVQSLGRLGDGQAVPVLISALHDSYRLVRAYAAGALAALADAQAIEPLLQVLEADDFFGVRAEAARAVALLSAGQADALVQRVRAVLRQRREVESASAEAGAERVVTEIDRAFDRLETKVPDRGGE
jgi:hypothetical protein